ncbi:MAG: ATP-binding protein [Pseudomonadota bacterium]|nr:ATP-binding protein [Pseudomonadota bacterium]
MGRDNVVPVQVEADILVARRTARVLAVSLDFSHLELTMLATAISEIARNMIVYGKGGQMRFEVEPHPTRKGIRVIARDWGPGIANISRAMDDGFSTGQGLGLGLPGARRLMDEFELSSTVGVGTTITMTKWRRG